jgi:hypothetical protein
MEFIIEQQARFAVGIQQLNEQQREIVEQHKGFVGDLQRVLGLVGSRAAAQENTNAIVANLAERVGDISRAQIGTDQSLNTLISIMEPHLSSHD